MGLLSRANNLDEIKSNPGMAFSDFINKHYIKICALLEKKDTNYYVTNSIGFDALSILSATSTADFWEGICNTTGQIFTFKDFERTKLLQLFSFNMKDNLQELSVYKNKVSQILLCSGIIDDDTAKDFENIGSLNHETNIFNLNPLIKENSVVLLFQLDFSEAINSFYESQKYIISDFENFHKTIMNELYNRFSCRYNISDTTIKYNSSILKTVFITDKEYSIELITMHIILNLKELLNDSAELIDIAFMGTANSCDEVQSFLQAE